MSVKRFVPAIVWFVTSVVLLCLPGSVIPKNHWYTFQGMDKCVHIVLFFVLCFLFARPFRNSGLPGRKRKNYFLLILICGIVYGTLMEFVQKYWIPNRSFELADIVADSTGCLLAYLFSYRKFLREG